MEAQLARGRHAPQTRNGQPQGSALPGPRCISAHEVYPLAEVARRLGWGQRSIRAAQRRGLRTIPFGKMKYCLGADVLRFFEALGQGAQESSD